MTLEEHERIEVYWNQNHRFKKRAVEAIVRAGNQAGDGDYEVSSENCIRRVVIEVDEAEDQLVDRVRTTIPAPQNTYDTAYRVVLRLGMKSLGI